LTTPIQQQKLEDANKKVRTQHTINLKLNLLIKTFESFYGDKQIVKVKNESSKMSKLHKKISESWNRV
jgi:hypothetical protein